MKSSNFDQNDNIAHLLLLIYPRLEAAKMDFEKPFQTTELKRDVGSKERLPVSLLAALSSRENVTDASGAKCLLYVEQDDEFRAGTAHDWLVYKKEPKEFSDEGVDSYFWRAHTLTVFFIAASALCYAALVPPDAYDRAQNIKRGTIAVMLLFIVFMATHMPDGPFMRPHPVVWRLVYCLTVLYELVLVFILFQTPDDARKLLTQIDPSLGIPLPEKSYGGACVIYDRNNTANPFHNVWDKMDGFVITHFFGWWFKVLILRDVWISMVLSIMFEFLEYSLEHQLPNFSECWWDHWIMDVIVCNGAGIYVGMKTLKFLRMKPYRWRSLWTIPTYSGKIKRVAAQFTPYYWIEFDWRPTSSLKRWFFTLFIVFLILVAELNCFYLKFILWIPPPHYVNLLRLLLFLLTGAVALRETFQYLDDPNCKKFGRQSLVLLFMLVTEILIIVKFDFELVTRPFPPKIAWSWGLGIAGLILWTLWEFFIKRWTLRVKDQRRTSIVATLNQSAEDELEQDINSIRTNGIGPLEFSTVTLRRRSTRGASVTRRNVQSATPAATSSVATKTYFSAASQSSRNASPRYRPTSVNLLSSGSE